MAMGVDLLSAAAIFRQGPHGGNVASFLAKSSPAAGLQVNSIAKQ